MSDAPKEESGLWESPLAPRANSGAAEFSPRTPYAHSGRGAPISSSSPREDTAVSAAAAGTPPRPRAPGASRIAVLGITKSDVPLTSPRRPSGSDPVATAEAPVSRLNLSAIGKSGAVAKALASANRSSGGGAGDSAEGTPAMPLTASNLEKLESWYRSQSRKDRAETPKKAANTPVTRVTGDASHPTNQRKTEQGGSEPDSEEDDVYNARIEQDVVSFVDDIRGLTLYLDPCPPLPTAGLTPASSPRVASPRTGTAGPSTSPRTESKAGAADDGALAARMLRRRAAEKTMERVEIEKKIRYITRDQLRQMYLDNHEELIDCIEELVAAEAKALELDDQMAALEKRVILAEEELELARIQLTASEECNESLLDEKAEAMRKLMESQGELAMLSARNIKLQQRLEGEDKSRSDAVANDAAAGKAGSAVAGATPTAALPAALQAKLEKELQESRRQVERLKTELEKAQASLAQEQSTRRKAEDSVAERVAVEVAEKCSRAQREVEELREKCTTHEKELAAARDELETLRQQPPRRSSPARGLDDAAGDATERRPRSNSAVFSNGNNASFGGSQRSPSNPPPAESSSSSFDAQKDLARVKAELARCECELALEREHNRKQADVEAKLLTDVAHMARQLRSKEHIERGVRVQRKTDMELTKEQLVEELAELRGAVVTHEATIAALRMQNNAARDGVSARSAGTCATNTTDNGSRSSSAADHLTKDYTSLTLPGASHTLSARMHTQSVEQQAARSPRTSPRPTPSRLPARLRYTNQSSQDSAAMATASTAAPTPTPEAGAPESAGPSPDRMSSPEQRRRRDGLFAQLEAARLSRERFSSLIGDPIDPKAGITTPSASGRQAAVDDATRSGTPPALHQRVGSSGGGAYSPRGTAVVPIAPPVRPHGNAFVMYAPATKAGDGAGRVTSPRPLDDASPRQQVGSHSANHLRTSPVPEGTTTTTAAAKGEPAKPLFTGFSLAGVVSSTSTSRAPSLSESRRRSSAAALSASRPPEDENNNSSIHRSLSLSNAIAGAATPREPSVNDNAAQPLNNSQTAAYTRSSGGSATANSSATTPGAGKSQGSTVGRGKEAPPRAKKSRPSATPSTSSATATVGNSSASGQPSVGTTGATPAYSKYVKRTNSPRIGSKGSAH